MKQGISRSLIDIDILTYLKMVMNITKKRDEGHEHWGPSVMSPTVGAGISDLDCQHPRVEKER